MARAMKVLVADDNRLVRETMRHRLASWGIEALVACDGEEAWEILRGPAAPRVAILDWSMPGADGLEVCRRVRAAEADHYTYLVVLTANDGEEAIEAGFAAGADDYLCKSSAPHLLRTRLDVAARIVAVQEELLRAREILHQQARLDALTGLLNRRAGEEELERELRRAARGATSFGVVLLDVDHFKSINDGYGHAVGDRVLVTVADVMRSELRAEDLVARWGGEEFLMILTGVGLQEAVLAAERVRAAITDSPFWCGSHRLQVTASAGVAAVPPGGRPRHDVLAAADAALYRAKEASRNCVVAEDDDRDRTELPETRLSLGAVLAEGAPVV